ncbi:MAG: hypothetical protein U0531_13885 [Dehalococcoidia bacterium]
MYHGIAADDSADCVLQRERRARRRDGTITTRGTEPRGTAMDERPLIGVTLGDPAGVGPEVVAAALGAGDLYADSRPVVIGDAGALERAARAMKVTAALHVVARPEDGRFTPS